VARRDRVVHDSGGGSAGFADPVTGSMVESVEAKEWIDVNVIGQCIAGVDMFPRLVSRS
jgi:hypothetical protein